MTPVSIGFRKVPSIDDNDDDVNICDSQIMSKEPNRNKFPSSSVDNLKRLEYKALDYLIGSKGNQVKALNSLIAVKKSQLSRLKESVEGYSIKATKTKILTSETPTSSLVNLHKSKHGLGLI